MSAVSLGWPLLHSSGDCGAGQSSATEGHASSSMPGRIPYGWNSSTRGIGSNSPTERGSARHESNEGQTDDP